MKLARYLANLGYGSRKEMMAALQAGRVTDAHGAAFGKDDHPTHDAIRMNGEPLDPPPGSLIALSKPAGYTVSRSDAGPLVYDLLPQRFQARKPLMAPIGRLDKDTTGLLLFTDDGTLQHRLISPKSGLEKEYTVALARPLKGDEAALFATGTFMLKSETKPLKPAHFTPTGPRAGRIVLTEGRYHQIRRMFAATGNHVEALQRLRIGPITVDGLMEGHWRVLSDKEKALLQAF